MLAYCLFAKEMMPQPPSLFFIIFLQYFLYAKQMDRIAEVFHFEY